ncbi:MAG: PAS domain S-box protein, partial [Nitrospirae bacterium]|nr:PAS domain S-box protein [Nitrospirota bacterium]
MTYEEMTKEQLIDELRVRNHRTSEDRYRTFLEFANDAIIVAGVESGIIVNVNKMVEELMGYTREEIIGMHQKQLHPFDVLAEDGRFSKGFVKHVAEGKTHSAEDKIIRKDGTVLDVSISARVIEIGTEEFIIGIFRDITERKKLIEELRFQSEMMSNMAEGVTVVNTDGIIVFINPKFEQMFGYDAGELIGQNISIVNAPTEKTPEETAREIKSLLYKHGSWQGEILNIKKNGTHFWCYASVSTFIHSIYGKVGISVHTDITQRKQVEQNLLSVMQRLELAKQSAKFGIWDWDITNNIMTWDDQMLELYGLTWETFPGGVEAWQNGLHPEDRDKSLEQCNAALRGENEYDTDFRVLHPDGTVRHIKANGMVIRDSMGTAVRMLGINYDITERKRRERQEQYRNHTMLTTLIDNVPDIAWIKDRDGRFIIVNEAYSLAVNMPVDAMIGKTDYDVWPRDLVEHFLADDRHVMATGRRKLIEETFIDAKGQVRVVETIKTPMKDENDVVTGTVGIARDITGRKRMEE